MTTLWLYTNIHYKNWKYLYNLNFLPFSFFTEHNKDIRPKGTHRIYVNNEKQTPNHRNDGVKRCPVLLGKHHIYIQTQKKKRFHLTIGGHAYLLPNTSLIIKCPVRRFPKMFIRWIKDGRPVASSKHLTITKSGSLKIPFVSADDVGVYRCVAGPAYEIFTLQLIGSENQSTGRRLPSTPRSTWEERKPTCYTHNIHLDGVSVSLLPPSGHNASLQPRLREKLINITLQADRGEIEQEQGSELIASLLISMSDGQIWTRTTEERTQARGKSGFHWLSVQPVTLTSAGTFRNVDKS